MPELPEVETLCRQLHAKIAGETILAQKAYDQKLYGIGDVSKRIVRRVRRRGKTILVDLDNGQSLAIHLRMSGRLFWHASKTKLPHTRWRLNFTSGHADLVDPRRFATVKLENTVYENAGREVLTRFDERAFLLGQSKRKICVKTLMMDPKAIAGIGNIYACEILYDAGISPWRSSSTITSAEWKKIFHVSRCILEKAIEKRGTSISDWRDLYGHPGENQYELQVYSREGRICARCGDVIQRVKQGGRSTYYCAGCQK
ncbi:MAG TPA: bifunctional DNA-formamidopyrimidine glycosylase/DNA-(apurinic or apyrimidinic site) lyase [Smithellaceae bacterium]|nr:bifunctional DNA-formamidopyrimidine glycosylase/DNA-(apurinic or apyrimidinic site) lyase [Smithellaceae bacterium]